MHPGPQKNAVAGTNPHGNGRYIPILDGWRAVAILLVILFHGFLNTDIPGNRVLRVIKDASGRTGAMGVLIFFCISGFLITQRLLVEDGLKGSISLSAFYIRRAFRILPPLAVYLLVILVLFLAGVLVLSATDWAAPLFVANYVQGSWYTQHFWSLSVEEHFYLFWPVCIVLAGWRRSMWIGILIIVAVAIWRPWELRHTGNIALTLRHTDMRLDYLMMGCVAAIALHLYPSLKHRFIAAGSPLGLGFLLAALLVTVKIQVIDLRSVQALILTLMICGSSLAEARWCKAVLANRPMLFMGKISYSLYIWQQLFTAPYLRSPWVLPLKYAAALGVAMLSYQFVERPFIRYGRRLTERRSKPVEGALQ